MTGATGGLGFETARVLAGRGAQVYVGGRSLSKATKAVTTLQQDVGASGGLTPVHCSLESLKDVRTCSDALAGIKGLDILVLNAGIAWVPEPTTTVDGFEKTMGVNHLAHFYLTELLLPRMLAAKSPRVVVLSSSAHAMSDAETMADPSLGMSKLLNGPDVARWLGVLRQFEACECASCQGACEAIQGPRPTLVFGGSR